MRPKMEATNVTATLAGVDRAMLRRAVDDLAARRTTSLGALRRRVARGRPPLRRSPRLLRADVQLLDGPTRDSRGASSI
jgi:hypothetical protein